MKYLNYQNLALVALLSGAVFFISAHYIDSQQKQFATSLLEEIKVKEAAVLTAATLAKDSKLNDQQREYISDCSVESRQRFDANLDRLVSLTPDQIKELKPLFEACGPYFAKVKTALVYELDRELKELEILVTLASDLGIDDSLSTPIETWREFYKHQQALALALDEQFEIQLRINELLITGVSATDRSVQTLVTEARQLSETAREANGRSDQLYREIKI